MWFPCMVKEINLKSSQKQTRAEMVAITTHPDETGPSDTQSGKNYL